MGRRARGNAGRRDDSPAGGHPPRPDGYNAVRPRDRPGPGRPGPGSVLIAVPVGRGRVAVAVVAGLIIIRLVVAGLAPGVVGLLDRTLRGRRRGVLGDRGRGG